jgi:hypothetical protein
VSRGQRNGSLRRLISVRRWSYIYIKGKVVTVLIKHYAVKKYGGVDVYIHVFLTSALVGGEWSASRPGRFNPGKEPPVPIV